MLNTLRRIFILSLAIILFSSSHAADATPLVAGDQIHVLNGPGTTGGGEFTIVADDFSFISFCLQQTEYINFVDAFNIDAISTYALSDPAARGGDGVGRDYLSAHTAYLYTQFREGSLSGYDYLGANHTESANQLQYAIWMFEQEMAMNTSNLFVTLANTAISGGLWSGLGDVRVLNLSLGRVESQDQLMLLPSQVITAVPEPASLLLFGTGLSVAAGMAKRRARREAAKKPPVNNS